ncbi:MAG: FAD-binding oxidoreductase [Candidatus Binataceae bacterium]|nr:FAD-binding oxidoreductase [Candidatus Binataceae bacterium]
MVSPLTAMRDSLARSIDGDVRFDAAARALYSTDASNYRRVPIGVVTPRHAGDVARALAFARDHAMPVLPRGGGTALGGQTVNAALVLDFSQYMNAIVAIDPARRVAIVEPGVVQVQLNAAAAAHGLFFAPDPSTKDRCTLGGMIGNNSCGAHSAAHGKTVDNVEALDVMLYDGTRLTLGATAEASANPRIAALHARLRAIADRYGDAIRARYPKIPRRVSGYNLDELLPENGFNLARALVGAEGTLATILGATVRLVPRPAHLGLIVLGFDDVYAAADQMPWMLEQRPQALEGFDHHLPDIARARGVAAVNLLPAGRAFLIVEVGGDSADEVRSRAAAIANRARTVAACSGGAVMLDPADQLAVWRLRESGLGAGAFVPGQPRTWPGAEDCAVPPARLGDFLRRFVKLLDGYGLAAATYYGHFGEGCVHCRINFDLFSTAGIAQFRAAMIDIADLVVEFGGSLSGEHGDGRARSELLPKMFGAELIGAFHEFKRAFDPAHRMNPGVIVDPEPLDANLRIGASYRPAAIRTRFDFSAEGGLGGAALKCVGIGKCRKTDAGVMCPSYMATREETHSTRGRARLIFEALNGDLLKGGFADDALFSAMELCLSCKACKSECPASVDMAKYKAEFLANYYESHRRPLAANFFAHIHQVARLGTLAPRLANALTGGVGGTLIRNALGVHPERALPRIAAMSFRTWFARRGESHPADAAHGASDIAPREVVLFPDTFNNFFEPAVAIAATEVLERAGFRVLIPPGDLCCGRPLYDQGLLDRARRRMLDVLAALTPFVARGLKVVGLEPSCILTFRDELPALFPRLASAQALAGSALMLDEFLAQHAPGFAAPALSGRAIVHGHCHQKSIAGLDGELALLRSASDLSVEAPDAGCCGMAGAFGYGADRFAVSRKIGDRVLIPAINQSAPETLVIADGFACRAQIRQFCAGRRPLHLAEVLNYKPASAP